MDKQKRYGILAWRPLVQEVQMNRVIVFRASRNGDGIVAKVGIDLILGLIRIIILGPVPSMAALSIASIK